MARIEKQIQCPCSKVLGKTDNDNGGGTKVCPSCKQKVYFLVKKGKVHTSYTRIK